MELLNPHRPRLNRAEMKQLQEVTLVARTPFSSSLLFRVSKFSFFFICRPLTNRQTKSE